MKSLARILIRPKWKRFSRKMAYAIRLFGNSRSARTRKACARVSLVRRFAGCGQAGARSRRAAGLAGGHRRFPLEQFGNHPARRKQGTGLARLAAHYGIEREEVMAFGDHWNDAEMLEWAGESFAMENAIPEIRARAKHIAPSNAEDGVARTIEELLLC